MFSRYWDISSISKFSITLCYVTRCIYIYALCVSSYISAECTVCSSIQFINFVSANTELAGYEWLHISGRNGEQFDKANGPAIIDSVVIGHLEYERHHPQTLHGLVLPFASGNFIYSLESQYLVNRDFYRYFHERIYVCRFPSFPSRKCTMLH